jgi:cell division septation protein DedD
MSLNAENESEIVLGTKQLLAIFFVIAILLGIAFTGGYMVGHGSPGPIEKKQQATSGPGTDTSSAAHEPDSAMETHPVGPAGSVPDDAAAVTDSKPATPQAHPPPPLGTPKEKAGGKPAETDTPATTSTAPDGYTPETGQTFLQVTALARDEAYGVAAVLTKKGFHAHSVPMSNNAKLYRVLVGPIRDTAELSSTRDALRKSAGFQEVIVRRY